MADHPETREIVLPARLELAGAGALRDDLIGALGGPPVSIDGAATTSVDLSCLQVLCAFVRDAAQTGQQVRWSGTSSALVDSARRLGLTDVLRLASKG